MQLRWQGAKQGQCKVLHNFQPGENAAACAATVRPKIMHYSFSG
jgi:hypothetical protein